MLRKRKHRSIIAFIMSLLILAGTVLPAGAAEEPATQGAGFAGTDAEWEALREAAKNRSRRTIYDNDGDDAAILPRGQAVSGSAILAKRTSFLTKYPVDTITYSITRGGFDQLVTPTTAGTNYHVDFSDPAFSNLSPYNTSQNPTAALQSQGTDALKLQIDFARENGIEIFAGIRVNDAGHDNPERPTAPHPLFSQFKRDNPGLLMGSWDNPPIFGHWSAYNFAMETVRNKFYAVMDELLTNYASDYDGLDGIMFDFNRDSMLFKSAADGGTVSDAERATLTALFTAIRSRAEVIGKERGRPILIAVKVQDSVAFTHDTGVDLEAWLQDNLVDLVIGATHLEPWADMAAFCHQYGAKYYPSVELEMMPADKASPAAVNRRSVDSFLSKVSGALAAGADGIQYFNLVADYYVKNVMSVSDEELLYKSKRYMPTDNTLSYHKLWLKDGSAYSDGMPRLATEEPLLVLPGVESELYIEVGDDVAAARAAGKAVDVTAAIYGRIERPQDLIATIGGQRLEYLSSVGELHYFNVPDNALAVGKNRITLTMPADGPGGEAADVIMKGDQALSGGYQAPWRRIYSGGAGSSETIVDGKYRVLDASASGTPNMHYSLALPESKQYNEEIPLVVNFSCQVVSASADRSVALYVADGKYVTEVSLREDSVSFSGTGSTAPLDTTIMRQYQLRITDTMARLYVDGAATPILEAAFTPDRKVFSENTMFKSWLSIVGGLGEHGLLFGSLSLEGTSEAYWQNIELVRPRNSAWINEMSVQVNYSEEAPAPRALKSAWLYETDDAWVLPAGSFTGQNAYMAAEVEMEVTSGAAVLTISNGTWITQQIITPDLTELRQAGDRGGLILRSWTGAESVRRAEIEPSGTRLFNSEETDAVSALAFTPAYIPEWLNSKDATAFTPAEKTLIQQGGVLVKKLSEESQVSVTSIRATISTSYPYEANAEGLLLFEDDCSDWTAKGWTIFNHAAAAGKALHIADSKGNFSNTSTSAETPPAGQYLALYRETDATVTFSSLQKTMPIGGGSWTLELDAKLIDLVRARDANDISSGFSVQIFAGGRRWRVAWASPNEIRVLGPYPGQPTWVVTRPPVLENPMTDGQFHTYTVHYDGDGKLSVGIDGVLLHTFEDDRSIAGSGSDRIEIHTTGGATANGGTNEVYLDNIALYTERLSTLKLPATVAMSDDTVTYNGEPHTLTAITEPQGKTLTYRYAGADDTEYPETTAAPTDAGTYKVTAEIDDGEYMGSAEATLTIGQAEPTADAVAGTLAQGRSLADITLSGAFRGVNAEALDGTLAWDLGDSHVPAETGEFDYAFTPDSSNYSPVTGTMAVTVNADQYKPPLDLIFPLESLSLTGSAKITGNVGTNSVAARSIDFAWSTSLEGDLLLGPGADSTQVLKSAKPNPPDNVTGSISTLEAVREYPMLPFPAFPDPAYRGNLTAGHQSGDAYEIRESGAYGSISVTRQLSVHVGDEDVQIVTDNLSVTGSGSLVVNRTGSGRLIVYVKKQLSLSGSAKVNAQGSPDGIVLYYAGSGEVNVGGSTRFVGSVFAKDAAVAISGSGSLVGNVVTGGGSVTVSGGTEAVVGAVYAPGAQLRLSGSGIVKGAVVARSIQLSGSSRIVYDDSISADFFDRLDSPQE